MFDRALNMLLHFLEVKKKSAECLTTPHGPFLAMFKAMANEFGHKNTQPRHPEDILLTAKCKKSVEIN